MAIFVEGHISDVMGTVFNAPMSSVQFKETFCIGLLRGKRSYSVYGFCLHFAGFERGYFPFDLDDLPTVRKRKVVIEESRSP
jgi:hypothetical protein